MSERMTTDLVIQALFRATDRKFPEKSLILHSDRGSQYCAHDYQGILKQFGLVAFMSGKGDCWDNAPMESFWGILKSELKIQNTTTSKKGDYRIYRDLL
jgi:putative transposase